MNKKELIAEVAEKTGTTKVATKEILEGILESVMQAVADGDKVSIPGFGVFESKYRPAHSGRNPRTKELVEIPAHTTPVFKAGKEFKDKVNK